MDCKFCNFKDNNAGDLFCKSCGKIIDISSLNSFEVFSLPVAFQVDLKSLNSQLLKLQGVLHPDKFIGKKDEQEISISNSTHVNSAYKLLKNHIKRAELMLNLAGIDPKNDKVTDMEFLMRSFAWREELESGENIDDLEQNIEDEYNAHLQEFAKKYEAKNYDTAKEVFLKLRFYKRFLDEIEESQEL